MFDFARHSSRCMPMAELAFSVSDAEGPPGAQVCGLPSLRADVENFVDDSAILQEAAQGAGNFGLGSGTAADAERLGRAWVGPNFAVSRDGSAFVSADGLRQYRRPSFKPSLGRTQANFERRLRPSGSWESNGHLDITDR
jgi:filamentous hemagglutinin